MRDILFVQLKAINGWSYLQPKFFDVARICNIKISKRKFIILNRKYPYTAHIEYYVPVDESMIDPILIPSNVYKLGDQINNMQIITKRYKSLDDFECDKNIIYKNKNKIAKYFNKIKNELENI